MEKYISYVIDDWCVPARPSSADWSDIFTESHAHAHMRLEETALAWCVMMIQAALNLVLCLQHSAHVMRRRASQLFSSMSSKFWVTLYTFELLLCFNFSWTFCLNQGTAVLNWMTVTVDNCSYKCIRMSLDVNNRCPKCNQPIEKKDEIFPNFLCELIYAYKWYFACFFVWQKFWLLNILRSSGFILAYWNFLVLSDFVVFIFKRSTFSIV